MANMEEKEARESMARPGWKEIAPDTYRLTVATGVFVEVGKQERWIEGLWCEWVLWMRGTLTYYPTCEAAMIAAEDTLLAQHEQAVAELRAMKGQR